MEETYEGYVKWGEYEHGRQKGARYSAVHLAAADIFLLSTFGDLCHYCDAMFGLI